MATECITRPGMTIVDEAVTALCEASGLGVSISLIPENQQLLFEVLEGVDRSANQSNRPPMIFNVDYDNVTNREFISDISEYKNTAIVAGQGEGAERRIRYVGNENSGLERYELFVDARDIEDDTALPDRGKSKNWQNVLVMTPTPQKWILPSIKLNGISEISL